MRGAEEDHGTAEGIPPKEKEEEFENIDVEDLIWLPLCYWYLSSFSSYLFVASSVAAIRSSTSQATPPPPFWVRQGGD